MDKPWTNSGLVMQVLRMIWKPSEINDFFHSNPAQPTAKSTDQ